MLRFIHASDLHLGNSGPGIVGLSKQWTERISNASYVAFENLINYALEANVDFLLLAGDVLDTSIPTLKSQLELYKGLSRLTQEGIKVFMVGGNHDPLNLKKAKNSLPEGVYLFDKEPQTIPFVKDGITLAEITGISYPVSKVSDDLSVLLKPGNKGFQIALLHTNVVGYGKEDNYAPSDLDKLIKSGFDYWALGHVHTNMVLNKKPYVVYSGTTQGQHINETGPKGFYLVEVDKDVKMEFVQTSLYCFEKLQVPAPESLDELDKIFGELNKKEVEQPSIYRVIVEGRTPLYDQLKEEVLELEERFKEGINYALESLVLEILPDIDYETIKQEDSLPGEFIREAEKMIAEGYNDEIKEVLDPLYSRYGNIVDVFSEEELESILRASIARGLDLFWRGDKS